MLEEQAEEQRARELEKQLAMMELDPNRTIMSVLSNELILYLRFYFTIRAPPTPVFNPAAEEDISPPKMSRTQKPILPYSSLFFLTSDNQ